MINVHRPYHRSRRRRVPVALITAADGVCHSTSAALIISWQRRAPRPRPCRSRTNERKQ